MRTAFLLAFALLASLTWASAFQTLVEDYESFPLGQGYTSAKWEGPLTLTPPCIQRAPGGGKRLGFSFSTTVPTGEWFEAEAAANSGAVVYSDPNASGGQAIGSFGEKAGDYVEFADVPRASKLTLYYNNGTGKTTQAGLYIAGKRVATLSFPDTGGWYSAFKPLTWDGDLSGPVRVQTDTEDVAANGTFCCNLDALSLGEPGAQPTFVLLVPLIAPDLDQPVEAVSFELGSPGLKLQFGVLEGPGNRLLWSEPFYPRGTAPGAPQELATEVTGRYTILLADLNPAIHSLPAGSIKELWIRATCPRTTFSGSLWVDNVILASGWPSTPPSDCPFEPSRDLTGISFTGRHAEYTNADTWYPTWAADGKLYSPFTDGSVDGVMSLSDNANATTGMAVIEGDDPLALKVTPLGIYTSRPWPFATRYPCGSLIAKGVWYFGTYILNGDGRPNGENTMQGPFVGFRTSTDYGKNWTETPRTPLDNLFGELVDPVPGGYNRIKMGSPHFVDFGRELEHSPDGKAYLLAHGNTDPARPQTWILGDYVYLVRAKPKPETLNDRDSYEVFCGYEASGKAKWGSFPDIQPLLSWPGRTGCVTATYNAPLEKYFMCVSTGEHVWSPFDTYILEADDLTGPWRLVTYMREFGRQAYFVNLPSKFISEDGLTMWLCYSANWTGHDASPRYGRYGMCLREIRLVPKD